MDGIRATSELDKVVRLLKEISCHTDPQAVIRAYAARRSDLFPVDRSVSLSRRDLQSPFYRITRSDLWKGNINPWTQKDQLPLLDRGLLGEMLYAGEPRIIDDLNTSPDDPAAEYFAGMGSLLAIPHFDNGIALNMVVHMRAQRAAFDHRQVPEFVLLSGLFGRAMKALVVANELEAARQDAKDQYLAMAELSDLVFTQSQALKEHSETLEQRVRQRTEELEAAHLDAIYMIAAASEEKDEDTARHLHRMQWMTANLAKALAMSESQSRDLVHAAILHDVGKLHVPDEILKKHGPLTTAERQIMQDHTLAGERILPDRPYFAAARRVARAHHENWNGTGYPDQLAARAIPLEARIVHVVDVYDALTSVRPYKPAWSVELALDFLRQERSTMFDPQVVDAFIASRSYQAAIP